MRWSATAPVTWPADHQWQRVWSDAVARGLDEVAEVGPDGTVRVTGAGPADPVVRLVGGTHLQPGAEYRIAPELTVGVLRAWVGPARAAGVEWAPYDEAGRAHVELQGLDRLTGVRGASTLRVVRGRLALDLTRPEHLLDLEVEVPWLRATVAATVRGGLLEVEVGVRGLGLWWPTLAPLFLGGRAAVQRELETAVGDLARSLTDLAVTGELTVPAVETLAQLRARQERQVREGMAELGRRQRAVAEVLSGLPWWRRTARRWRAEVAALPPVDRPSDGLVWPPTWPEVEQSLTDAVLERLPWRRVSRLQQTVDERTAGMLQARAGIDAAVDSTAGTSRTEPWLTDASFDLTWLETPTRLLSELRAGGVEATGDPQDSVG